MKYLRIAAVVALAGVLAYGCSKDKSASNHAFPDSIATGETIVTVNGDAIYGSDLMVMAFTTFGAPPDSLKSPSFNLQLLDQLIDRTIFYQEAKTSGISVADTVVADMMQRFEAQFGGTQQVMSMLTEVGLTHDDLARAFQRDLTIRNYVQRVVSPAIEVADADSRAYYEQNKTMFTPVDSVRARHIIQLFRPDDTDETRKSRGDLMASVHKRAVAGEDFGALARQYSQDGSASDGGDLGYFARGTMVKPFEDVAFGLKKGQVSGVVETQFGLHIIKVVDHKKAVTVSYDDVKPQVVSVLQQQGLNTELQNRLKRNRDAAIIVRSYETGA
jgi:parvulin-like peptidyl-prolyl isomerase